VRTYVEAVAWFAAAHLAGLRAPKVTEKLVPVFTSEELSALAMISRRGEQAGVDAWDAPVPASLQPYLAGPRRSEGDLMELNGCSSPQMLRRYGARARSARARRTYDRIMEARP
jgi:hypothetical protein